MQNFLSACVVFFATVSSMTSGLYGNVTPAMVGLSIAYAINVSLFIPKYVCGYQINEFVLSHTHKNRDLRNPTK